MRESLLYVGLDYHQKSVQVCVLNAGQQVLMNRSCANSWSDIAVAVGALGGRVQAAIEACCGSADLAEELVSRAGWSVDLAHPGYVARMKQSPDETDFSDARLLADLERVGYVPRVWMAPRYIIELRRLLHFRQALADDRRDLKLRMGALLRDQRVLNPPAGTGTQRWRRWVFEEAVLSEESRWIIEQSLLRLDLTVAAVTRAEARLERYVKGDPVVALLRSHAGIGLVTACALRAAVGGFDRFRSGRQLANFCGLSPRNASSGARQATAGLIGSCDRRLRATLIEAAHRMIRLDPYCSSFAERLLTAGKPYNVVVAATANRWVRRLYHTMKPLGICL